MRAVSCVSVNCGGHCEKSNELIVVVDDDDAKTPDNIHVRFMSRDIGNSKPRRD